ncbi:hypothetical protein [Nemorincola caseinilytica]
MEQYETEDMLIGHEAPRAVHYTRSRERATRRQHKHEMLLTFITHVNTPPSRKRKRRTAPIRTAGILKTFLSLFV